MSGSLIGHARCSSDEQDLTAQRDQLHELGVHYGRGRRRWVRCSWTKPLGEADPNVCHFSRLVWTSRLGHTYHRRPPAIIEPLPDPIPRDQPPYPFTLLPDDGWEDSQIWEEPPPDPDPDPPPELNPHGDVPPF
jgi:hypothetical protein